MVRALILGLFLATACGNSESGTSQQSGAPTAGDHVGKVAEVSGTVMATRDGKTRTLALGDPVAANDTIDTGKDGSIVIELFHNNARWSLESGIRTRVDESVAWAMSKQELSKQVGHSTTAAGRHGDREAAQTEVSGAGTPRPAAAVEAPKADKADPKQVEKELPTPKPVKPAVGTTKPAETTSAPCDEVSCILDDSNVACCAKYKKNKATNTAPNATGDSSLPEAPDRNAIKTGISAVIGRITACSSKKPQTTGTLKLAFRISPDGSVASVEVKQSVDPAIDSCAVSVMKTAKFPKSRSGTSVSYPILIAP